MYERHDDNLDTVRDGLLGPSGYDYKPGGLANIRERDRGVPEITRRFRGCEHVSYSSKYEWSGGRVSKRSKNEKLYFYPYRSDPIKRKCFSENRLV